MPADAIPPGLFADDAGATRCAWCQATPLYRNYHDSEWGFPVADERRLFEKICLEGFQSGLSWLTILRKREAFRAAFAGFDAEVVARFGDEDRERLMADAGIVRNRLKVDAAIRNAGAVLALRERGGLDAFVWSHAPVDHQQPRSVEDLRATSPESIALAKGLKKAGFVFVGPTTMYAAMQACGLVDDHLAGCHRATHGVQPAAAGGTGSSR